MRRYLPLVLAFLLGGVTGLVGGKPNRRHLPVDDTYLSVHMPVGVPADGKCDRVLDVYLIEEDGQTIFDRKRTEDSPPAWRVNVSNRCYYATSR